MKLLNKVALVTGGAHRVGRLMALALAREGADIVLHYGGSAAAAKETACEVEALGRRVLVARADMSQWDEAIALGQRAIAHFGKVDILINSASSFVPNDYFSTREADFDKAMDVNLKGAFALSQVFAKSIFEDGPARRGDIINIVDEGAFFPGKQYVAHGISKAALLALTRSQTLSFGPKIRVNAICPGPALRPEDMSDDAWQKYGNSNPLKLVGQPDDMGEVVLFLLTGPRLVNGDCIMLEGGRMWKHE
jgi:NAD(P)-dependent dehydrogenase (short-subunit alcohol dehydrogenase family)